MIYADTAIVGNGAFFHFCHGMKGLMALRIHWEECPICTQKNPDYIPNKLVHTVINLSSGKIILVFANQIDAVTYVLKRPFENLALGDTGFVE